MKSKAKVIFTKREMVEINEVSMTHSVYVTRVEGTGTEYMGTTDTYLFEAVVSCGGEVVHRNKGIVDVDQDWKAQEIGLEQWDRLDERSLEFAEKWKLYMRK